MSRIDACLCRRFGDCATCPDGLNAQHASRLLARDWDAEARVARSLQAWKRNRRNADARRVPLIGQMCEECGATEHLTRHHVWREILAGRGRRRPVILCAECHRHLERVISEERSA